jgi:hypothetical protein
VTSTAVEETGTRVVSMAAEETDGVESDGVERESGGDLEYFGMKREITWDGLIFIGSKISEAILN